MNLSRGSICIFLLVMLVTALAVCPALGESVTATPAQSVVPVTTEAPASVKPSAEPSVPPETTEAPTDTVAESASPAPEQTATAEPETAVTEEPLDFSSRVLTGQRIPWDVTVMPNVPHAKAYLPDNAGYQDTSLDIRVETMRRDDTDIMLVYVRIADPTQLRCTTPTTRLACRSKAPVSAMAKNVNAVLAINGDYYSYHSDGIVIRNGERFREKPNKGRDTLIIDDKGDFTILAPTTPEAYETFEGNIIHAFCFGPGLVVDGQPLTNLDTVELDVGKSKKTQRIAIGQLDHLSYLIVTTEGPENKGSVGFDLLQMAALCKELGCVNAYNLDGGSSSTIVLNNEKINALSSRKIRSVGDCIFFATLEP